MSLNKMADEFNAQYGLEQRPVDYFVSMFRLVDDEAEELFAEIFNDGGE
jgi:hypothetical protein